MRISKICRNIFLAALLIFFGHNFQARAQASPADAASLTTSNTLVSRLAEQMKTANQPIASVTPAGQAAASQVLATGQKTAGLIPSCQSRMKAATALCLESTAPSIGKFLTEHGAIVQMISSMGSNMAGQCSTIGDMLKKANLAITAFQIGCSGAQALCESACGGLVTSAGEYLAAGKAALVAAQVDGTVDDKSVSVHIANATSIQQAVKESTSLCGSYKANIGSALMGVMSTLTGMQTANNCKDKNSDVGTLDCNNQQSTVYNSNNCRCVRNELPAAECQNINLASLAVPGKNGIAIGAGGVPEGSSNEGIDLDDENAERNVNADVGIASAGAPIEGGGGSVSGGGGGSGAQDGSRGAARSRLNPNILGGFSGGGGGGGGSGAGPGYGDIDPQMKAYMPGQEKDPARALASEFKKQVSHPDGRSNWEKVNRRYMDNYRNLLKN